MGHIADSMKGITENIIASHDVREKELKELVSDTHKTIKGFAADREKMSKEQAKNLSDNVGTMLKGFKASHKEMADNLKESLEKGETDRLKDFKGMMGNIQKGIKDIENYVAKQLKEFHDVHAKMSEQQKKDLANEVKNLLGEYSLDMAEAKAAWQGLAATMGKKSGVKPRVAAEVKVRPVERAIEEVSEKEEVSEVSHHDDDDVALEKKVLKFIKKHTEGVKVGDMEEALGVPRIKLGVIAKKLLDEGAVRKEGNMYFPL